MILKSSDSRKEPKYHFEILKDFDTASSLLDELNFDGNKYYLCDYGDNSILVTDDEQIGEFFQARQDLARLLPDAEVQDWMIKPKTVFLYKGNEKIAEHLRIVSRGK